MSKIVLLTLLAMFFFINADCKKDIVDPPAENTDTTSHNFVFSFDTLGEGNGTSLYDVAIINDTLAYAVGEIYLKDSTGQFDEHAYNLAKWDGKNWKLYKIMFFTFCDQLHMGSYPIKSIFAINDKEIWLNSNSELVKWNGIEQNSPECISISGLKIWALTANNIYVAGYNGGLIHYNGSMWKKLESGTNLPIRDIWGAQNQATGEWEILAIASNVSADQGRKLLRITENKVRIQPDSGLSWSLSGLWFDAGKSYYISGDGLYNLSTIGSIWTRDNISPFYKTSVRGNNQNDVFVAGAYMLLMHYNGNSWYKYFENINGVLGRVEIKNNFVVAVGTANNRGIVVRGYRK